MAGKRGSFRIIAGEWRSRRFDFVTDRDVRPSPDRVRETLFNWLAPVIEGTRCLDLYAGSGALGLEALSRGAAQVVFVDHEAAVVSRIRQHLQTLGAGSRAEVVQTDAAQYLARAGRVFDIVFLDPPFEKGLIAPTLERLGGLLKPGHRVYIESEIPPPALPQGWEPLKFSRAGRVASSLVSFSPTKHNSSP